MQKTEHYEIRQQEYLISTDISLLDIDVIHGYLSIESYWAKNIPRATVERSINNALCFGLYYRDQQTLAASPAQASASKAGRQVGFARVISDKATFAYLADVFILEGQRGKGLSKWLLQVIHAHPDLQGLRRWVLGTRDAHGLYEQFGWTVMDEDTRKRFMQKHDKNIYQTS